MINMLLSDEQQCIIDTIGKRGNCCIVEAVAGAGKTSTSCHLSLAYPDKRVIIVTYNKHLEIEVKQKTRALGCNTEVFTYHGLAGAIFKRICRTDEDMIKFMSTLSMHEHKLQCDILVVDEAQDMTLNYFQLIHMFLQTFKTQPCVMIMGDPLQSVYAFKGADDRFLIHADRIYRCMNNATRLTLQTSYRLTESMAWFMNNIIFGNDEFIRATKSGPPVEYIICNPFEYMEDLADTIVDAINNKEVEPSDVFILAYTMGKGTNPIKMLENILVSCGIPCYSPTSDQGRPDEDVIQGKVVFSTFHQSKGRERKWVIVFGVDEGYYTFYDKKANRNICPPPLYVAMTRASHRLTLIHTANNAPLPFLKKSMIELQSFQQHQHVTVKTRDIPLKTKQYTCKEWTRSIPVTDLVKFIPDKHNIDINTMIQQVFRVESPGQSKVSLPTKVPSKYDGQFEEVSDITAIALTFMWVAECLTHSIAWMAIDNMLAFLKCCKEQNIDHLYVSIAKCIGNKADNEDIKHFLRFANIIQRHSTGFMSRTEQIQDYTWFPDIKKNACMKHMCKRIQGADVLNIEKTLSLISNNHTHTTKDDRGIAICHPRYGKFMLTGRIDVETSDTVWEVKCVDEITMEHQMQLVVYAFMWMKMVDNGVEEPKTFKLFNARDGQVHVLDVRSHLINEIVEAIFQAKLDQLHRLTDQEFLSMVERSIAQQRQRQEDHQHIITIQTQELKHTCIDTQPSGKPQKRT